MFVSPDYVREMARYNAWQNDGLRACVSKMPEAELRADRGAFFGSILGTLNHLMWGDMLWMARLAGGAGPKCGLSESPELCATAADWAAERFRMDRAITHWARGVRALDLSGDLTYHSVVLDSELTFPRGVCIAHFFNHQTHHRGQVHAMLTAQGQTLPDTDLILMPAEEP